MYERSPQKSPQLTILNGRSLVLTDHPDPWARVPKSVCRVLKWLSGYPGKRSRQSEITLQALVSGMGRLERKWLEQDGQLTIQSVRDPRRIAINAASATPKHIPEASNWRTSTV